MVPEAGKLAAVALRTLCFSLSLSLSPSLSRARSLSLSLSRARSLRLSRSLALSLSRSLALSLSLSFHTRAHVHRQVGSFLCTLRSKSSLMYLPRKHMRVSCARCSN